MGIHTLVEEHNMNDSRKIIIL